jgi:acetylornithine deacetylase
MSDVLALLERLIRARTPNPGGDELALAALLEKELARHGPDETGSATVARPGGPGAYVWARWGQPRLLVNAHLDTVPANAGWSGDPWEPRRVKVDGADGLMGLGSADTKGAIAAILTALGEQKPADTMILFSGDEELGGLVLRAFLDSGRAAGIERAIVCEPTSCRAGTRHRGVAAMRARLQGQGAHSSLADKLPAPLVDLARAAVGLRDYAMARKDDGPAGFPGLCLNVAGLDGGVAFNVVPKEIRLTMSVRPPPGADVPRIRAEVEAIVAAAAPGAEMVWPLDNPPFATRSPESFRDLFGSVMDAPIDLAFWTEAAALSLAGIDAVIFGPGDIARAHAADEWVPRADLERARDLFIRAFAATHGTG